jgi:poly(beta-D-mannuronate) lyase
MRNRFLVLAALASFAVARADCPAPPAPQRDIIADSYYDDPPVYSHIDPVKHAAYEAAVKPLESYLDRVARMASDGDKVCTLNWLVAWAEGDAMLGKIEKEQAHYERKWLLAGLALSYAKVRDGASRDQRAAIDAWLQALADGVRMHSEAYKGERNNHYYWEGLAVAAVGAVTGRKSDIDWGRKVFHDAENDIADDGTLPRELKRGARALHYHLFAAAPLAMLESILDERSEKIHKLLAFSLEGAKHPESVTKRVGVTQTGVLDDDTDWRFIYYRHISDVVFYGGNERQAYVNRLGGDLEKPNPLEHVAQN